LIENKKGIDPETFVERIRQWANSDSKSKNVLGPSTKRALQEMVIEGPKTSIPLHQRLLNEPDFLSGDYTIKWLEEWLAKDA